MYYNLHIIQFVLKYIYIYFFWSKPGSINTPQKQDENRGFGPGQQPADPPAN